MEYGQPGRIDMMLQAHRAGKTVKAILEEPILDEENVDFFAAYLFLSEARPVTGMGDPLMIPVSEVLAMCEFEELYDHSARTDLMFFVRALDREYMRYRREHNANS